MKNAFERIKNQWMKDLEEVSRGGVLEKLGKGEVTLNQYKAYLRETYYQAGANPQIQAFAATFFPFEKRKLVKQFYQHAISEIGHDLLAMNDLIALGEKESFVLDHRPLPETVATNAFAYYQIQYRSAIGYLGYIFHLEFLPTLNGDKYIKVLKENGVPANALSFLEEHSTIDLAHNKLMEGYINELVTSEKDLEEIQWVARTMCKLYSNMIRAIYEQNS